MIVTGSVSGSMVRPVMKIASPLVFQRSMSGASSVSLNFATLIDAGRMFGPVKSSHPSIGGPPAALQRLLHWSLLIALPSSHSSSAVTPPKPSTSSTSLLPQQPSPMLNCRQSDPLVHGIMSRVQRPEISQVNEHGLGGPFDMPRSHSSPGKSKMPSPQSHSAAVPPAQIVGHSAPGQRSHVPGSGRPLH